MIPKNSKIQQKDSNIIKGQWTMKEDSILVESMGCFLNRWNEKQCRKRFYNHHQPDIKIETWSEEEENILIKAHKIFGDNWPEISRRLPGRNEISIENHWNTIERVRNAKKNFMISMIKSENQPYYNNINKSSENDFEGVASPEDELDRYVPMTFNGDYGLYGMEFYPEVSMKKEIDFMKLLCSNL